MITKGNSIVSKGKTVKKAVMIALDLLSEKLEDVEIEIIENESKGILGIGSKQAVVRVTVKQQPDHKISTELVLDKHPPEELDQIIQSLDISEESIQPAHFNIKKIAHFSEVDLLGNVWVTDGQIYCKDAPDKFPVISPCKGLKLYKNDVLIEKTVIISENDILRYELEDEVQQPHWEISISANKMEAVLKVIPGSRIQRTLREKEPHSFLQVEVEEKKIPLMIDSELVMSNLREMGITYGIDYSEIANACMSEETNSFVIAKGIPAIPGKNGFFQPTQELDIKKGLEERSNGTVDYREIQKFPSVEPGQMLGIVLPPESGIPGTTITNEPVLPPDGFPLVVQDGRGIILVEDDTKVVAMEAGHPDIKLKDMLLKISIVPKLWIRSDVTLQVGNVRYIGEVEITGSVQDGMLVDAQGNILIHENVNMATISAGSSVIIKNNIITSAVTAGKNSFMIAESNQILGELIPLMKQMIAAINQLSTVSAFKVSSFTQTGLGPLIKILCDGKFKRFPPLLFSLNEKIKSGKDMLDKEWLEFGEQLYKGFIMTHASSFRSIADVELVAKKAEELWASSQEDQEGGDCFIKAALVHNSQLYSSGDITIVGQGVYHSKLRSGGSIEIDGYVRGGEIYAGKSVKVGEAGTKGGISTKIVVPKGHTIKIGTVMEDTIIQIGSFTYKFTASASNVTARVNEDGLFSIS
ncbi:FapA family protein [Paenibacillus alginolyticus]|uniref:FapA family protein n=1 Tax=Paenibacillus alginolyticus TaxID=59839 RepID=UPI00041176BB|nr:FapA family protein [Paenibacillus alginolyticus]MCY9666529.1 FapA family protein [Paenibacillus alginolyticus]